MWQTLGQNLLKQLMPTRLTLIVVGTIALSTRLVGVMGMLDGGALTLMIAIGAECLLAIWTVMGGKGAAWRLAAVGVFVTALVFVDEFGLAMLGVRGGFLYVADLGKKNLFAMLLIMGAQMIPLSIARFAGMELRRACPDFGAKPEPEAAGKSESNETQWRAAPRKLQWSLGSMLGWTTAAAILLSCASIWRMAGGNNFLPHTLKPWIDLAMIVAVFAMMPLTVLWATVARRWLGIRTVIPIALGVTMYVLFRAITRGRGGDTVGVVVFPLLWLTAALLLVRWSGYRLIWRGSTVL